MKSVIGWIAKNIGGQEVFLFVGLCSFGAGLAQISTAYALMGCGAVLIFTALKR